MTGIKIVSITQLKAQVDQLLQQIAGCRQLLVITRDGHACAVLEPFTEDHMLMVLAKRAEAENGKIRTGSGFSDVRYQKSDVRGDKGERIQTQE